jgi:hypothetical protein
MGGIGSGSWHYGAKDAADDYLAVDVRRWQRDGLLTPDCAFGLRWNGGIHPSGDGSRPRDLELSAPKRRRGMEG